MRIVCIGGGPAGLYFSILMKKAAPAADITVVERNAEGVTFGWGVVFSDGTLENLAENDPESHAEIQRHFAHWDAIDIVYRGAVIRSAGHGFSGIARRELLRILKERCAVLGVQLVFEREVDSLEPWRDADLIVACDGVNSKIRKAREAVFQPSIQKHHARYIWLGTRRRFDAFTFIFEANEHGIFQVHAYGFDAETSTFIVECDEQSWRNAGLDHKTTDESIAYLEGLFAKHLDGHRLLANNATWIQFLTIKNATWRDGRVVLVGDAAHTAHFSIGSGTKLAMEDAIALARACARNESIDAALEAYEAERLPIVERTQRAAEDSLTWFENVRGRARAEPHDFAFSLLTRSNRVTYDKLRERDPAFVLAVTQSFASRAIDAGSRPPGAAPQPLLTGFGLRGLRLANRVVTRPTRAFVADDGMPGDEHAKHAAEQSSAGPSLVFVDDAYVARAARRSPHSAGMYRAEHVAAWRLVVDAVHARPGVAAGLVLAHAGPRAHGTGPRAGSRPPGPRAAGERAVHDLDRDEMLRVTIDFVRATQMAADAGFDAIELLMQGGDLLSSFLAPLSNQRHDGYGGVFANRMRFPVEVFQSVREAWPAARPMGVRVSAVDLASGALTGDDAVALAAELRRAGCDFIDVVPSGAAPGASGGGPSTPFDHRIQDNVDIAVMAVGPVTTADRVNTWIAARRADLCVVDLDAAPSVRAALAAGAGASS